MPAYKYEALDADGRPSKGLIEADNPRTARAALRARQLVPLLVEAVAQQSLDARSSMFSRRVFSSTALAVWTRQLAGLVASGLPIERALSVLADECEDRRRGQRAVAPGDHAVAAAGQAGIDAEDEHAFDGTSPGGGTG